MAIRRTCVPGRMVIGRPWRSTTTSPGRSLPARSFRASSAEVSRPTVGNGAASSAARTGPPRETDGRPGCGIRRFNYPPRGLFDGEVSEPQVDRCHRDRHGCDDEAVLGEGPEADRSACTLGESQYDDVG